MSVWDSFPEDYRSAEIEQILRAVCSGDCAAVIGLSGSGKSNLTGFLAHRAMRQQNCPEFLLVDCNRLVDPTLAGFIRLLLSLLQRGKSPAPGIRPEMPAAELLAVLEAGVGDALGSGRICLLLDRFDALYPMSEFDPIAGCLRSLRDQYKYDLTYVMAARRLMTANNELAELFFGHTIWIGPLSQSDARWSASRDAQRFSAWMDRDWSEAAIIRLVELSWGYPSFLRAACEAYSQGADLDSLALRTHPAVVRRLDEFWADAPDGAALKAARLEGHPWLDQHSKRIIPAAGIDAGSLTAKESKLLEYLQSHAGQVCEKDDLVQAVWPEDVIYDRGVRDESLAQLVRRLRLKVEANPSDPQRLITIPGRGYLYKDQG